METELPSTLGWNTLVGAKEAASAATLCSLSVLWINNLLALLGLSIPHLAGDVGCDFHSHIQMAIHHTIQMEKHLIRRLPERTLVESRINAADLLYQLKHKDPERTMLPLWERPSLLNSKSAHPCAWQGQAHEIISGSYKYEQFGCFHFYFLLFSLYNPFCFNRTRGSMGEE